MAVFGRDSIVASYRALPFEPSLVEATPSALTDLQATELDDWRDAEPGKIPHELRRGKLAKLGAIPHTPYSGTHDAALLWLILPDKYERWTGTPRLFGGWSRTPAAHSPGSTSTQTSTATASSSTAAVRARRRGEGKTRGRATACRRPLQRLGSPLDVDGRRRLQPASLPHRNGLALRHPADRRGDAPVRVRGGGRTRGCSLLDAARAFSHQLPEVFAGLRRDETDVPVRYPDALTPQAWSAGRCSRSGRCSAWIPASGS